MIASKTFADFRPMTDLGNAERLADACGATLRYAEDRQQWLAWRAPAWRRGDTGTVYRAAAGTVRAIANEAAELDDTPMIDPLTGKTKPSDRQRMLAHGVKSESRGAQDNMIALAGHVPPISCVAADFDRDPWLLNTPSGIIDLRDGAVSPCRPEAMQSRVTTTEYHPLAASQVWRNFLKQITCDDAELEDWLHRAVGLSLIGTQREHVILFCFGGGANGKGTFLNALLYALGDYGMALPPNALMERKFEAHPTEIADLEGKRIAVGAEVPKSAAWNESLLKQITGGDPIRAHKMRQDNIEFLPSHTLWVAGNDKPRIRGTDRGIWRRMRMIPFEADIPTDQLDPDLPVKLQADSAAILAWAVDGCREYLARGLGMCAAVAAATDEYRRDEDVFGCFLEDCCILSINATCYKSTFRDALRQWLHDREYRPMTDRAIKAELTRRGVSEARDGRTGGWEWRGINLLTLSTVQPQWGGV